jgi:ribosomal protein S13
MEGLAREIVAVAREILAKDRPSDLFAGAFFDFREKLSDLKKDESEKIRARVEKQINSDLASTVKLVEPVAVKLGKYRGSAFVTSAKLKAKVPDKDAAEKLLAYLQKTYSPKYKLKGVSEDGIAEYNIR